VDTIVPHLFPNYSVQCLQVGANARKGPRRNQGVSVQVIPERAGPVRSEDRLAKPPKMSSARFRVWAVLRHSCVGSENQPMRARLAVTCGGRDGLLER